MNYDYIMVGSGIFGATVAERLANAGKKVLVIDRREHLAGNIYSYTDEETGIEHSRVKFYIDIAIVNNFDF